MAFSVCAFGAIGAYGFQKTPFVDTPDGRAILMARNA